MKRAETWLVSILLAVSTLGATAQAASAHTADVWSNSDAFSSTCLGFTDTYPRQLYNLAITQMAKLGYAPVNGQLGSGFTRTAFLNKVLSDWAVYAHTHGDNYWAASGWPNVDSAILQDPGYGRCNNSSVDKIRSSTIKAATMGTPYNLVIMSTCRLGSNVSTMPDAFQIEKTKSSTQREFYLGYVYLTYDSAQLRFEQAFWSYLNGDLFHFRTASQAFTYAMSIGGTLLSRSQVLPLCSAAPNTAPNQLAGGRRLRGCRAGSTAALAEPRNARLAMGLVVSLEC